MGHTANNAVLYRWGAALLDLEGVELVVWDRLSTAGWGELDGDITKVGLLGSLHKQDC